MKTKEEITAAFDRATNNAKTRPKTRVYWESIADALGWVLGEYEDDPTKS